LIAFFDESSTGFVGGPEIVVIKSSWLLLLSNVVIVMTRESLK